MPSTPRDQESSTYFHVFSRGADRQDIYSLDGDHSLFERFLAEMVERFDIEVHAFALMSNHFHLLVHAPSGELSESMRVLLSRYGRAYNARTNRSGPVFDSRFGSVPIVGSSDGDAEAHFYVAGRYIHRNPLAFVPAAALGAYRHSSLAVYLGRRSASPWLSTHLLAPMIDVDGYLDEVTQACLDDLLPLGALPPLMASTVEAVCEAAVRVGNDRGVGQRVQRQLIRTMAVELRSAPIDELANFFGVGAPAVRKSARDGRVRLRTDPSFAFFRQRVLDLLIGGASPDEAPRVTS